MGIFSKIGNLFKAKAHQAVSAAEDKNRVSLVELKIEELTQAHSKSISALAKMKAIEIGLTTKKAKSDAQAKDYATKAGKLKTKYEATTNKAEKAELKAAIITMLNRKENFDNESKKHKANQTAQATKVAALGKKIKDLKTTIDNASSDIVNKKAELEMAESNKQINKELSDVNTDGLTGQLEQLQTKIDSDNSEADAWDQIEDEVESEEATANRLLNEVSATDDDELFNSFVK